jgi:hypothetical protein
MFTLKYILKKYIFLKEKMPVLVPTGLAEKKGERNVGMKISTSFVRKSLSPKK